MARRSDPLDPSRLAAPRAVLAALAVFAAAGGGAAPVAVERPPPGTVVVLARAGDPRASCRVELERVPPAMFALATSLRAREENLGGDVHAVAVGLEGERPVLTVELEATAGKGAGRGAPGRFCAWVRASASQADDASAPPRPEVAAAVRWPLELDTGAVHFRSVQRFTRGGETIGHAQYWHGARPDGTRVLVSRITTFARRPGGWLSRGGWRSGDTIQVEEVDARGMLQRGRYVRLADGVDYRIELRRTGDRTFAYSGVAKGKPLDGSLDAPHGIATSQVRIELFRERAGYGPAEPVTLDAYAPGVDATRPIRRVLRRDARRPRGIAIRVGSSEAIGVVDRDGTLEWLEEPGDPPTRYETISRSGVP